MTDRFDIIVIGSGAGGGTLARALASTGARMLILERGEAVPQEPSNWDPVEVWKHLRYRSEEQWLDEQGHEFLPYMHYNVGGNSKFWGSVLFRLRVEDFGELTHRGGVSPAWPIDYATLAPFYDRAERMYCVHGEVGIDPTEPPRGAYPHPPIPHSAEMAVLVAKLRTLGFHPLPLPLALIDPGEPGGCVLCNTCNSFPCRIHKKGDAEVCGVMPALQHDNVTLWTGAHAERLHTDPSGQRVVAVDVRRGNATIRVEADLFIVSCGAVNSAALLLRSASDRHKDGLANSSGLVGRRYMAHHATMMEGFNPWRVNRTVFQKTVAINDYYLRGPDDEFPLGQIQSQGRTHGVMAQTAYPMIPVWAYDAWVKRGVDWLAMSEDLPDATNRVVVTADGRIQLDYRPNNNDTHRRLVAVTKQMLKDLGFRAVVAHSHGSRNTTHQCGTLCFGRDSRTSVLDEYCRAHDLDNLFVVDASFFPSSAAVNPALTIIAQALRVADYIASTRLGQAMTASRRDTRTPAATDSAVSSN
ncbi:MAG: GMC family oxidoreductase [Acidobacteriaceae bacterium]|nr:GMC family oxidoreductase [Acidobacteriaceae bacterium]